MEIIFFIVGVALGWYFNEVVGKRAVFFDLIAEVMEQTALFPGLVCGNTPEIDQSKFLPRLDRYVEAKAIEALLLGHEKAHRAFREISKEIEITLNQAGATIGTTKNVWVDLSSTKSSWLNRIARCKPDHRAIWLNRPRPAKALAAYHEREAEYVARAKADAKQVGTVTTLS